jgi:putative oxidoreductase
MANAPQTSVLALRAVLVPGGGAALPLTPQRAAARPISFPSKAASAMASRIATGGIDRETAPYAVWFLRLTLGAAFLEHVMRNLFGYVPADIGQLIGLPAGVSPFAITSEALVAVALLLGIWPRAAALIGAATLFGATVGASGTITDSVFGWPHPFLWIGALIAFALIGDGAFTILPTPTRLRKESVR